MLRSMQPLMRTSSVHRALAPAILGKLAPDADEGHGVGPGARVQMAALAVEVVTCEPLGRIRRIGPDLVRGVGHQCMAILDDLPERVVADRGDIRRGPFGEINRRAIAGEGDSRRHQVGGGQCNDDGDETSVLHCSPSGRAGFDACPESVTENHTEEQSAPPDDRLVTTPTGLLLVLRRHSWWKERGKRHAFASAGRHQSPSRRGIAARRVQHNIRRDVRSYGFDEAALAAAKIGGTAALGTPGSDFARSLVGPSGS
jgi:hypothetical protein